MKNFSELLDINPVLAVVIELKIHGQVDYCAKLNQHQLIEYNKFSFDLWSPLDLLIRINQFDEGTSGIEIVEFSVDGLQVLPLYQHMANPPTHYIDQLGTWYLTIPAPFHQWYHTTSGQGWILNPV
jgi:hypothetical protein